ncbi:hypothetical protein LJY18_14310 [Pseudomonas sp. MMS21-TM103]|uniref:hypothetical protein n=1 Tax=Pseudomonas sp. MMS21 TM103 TaxID=2886506 RepID=UPI001EDD00F6|nr:hypothetical protein [Pseudomonas sp. MMS21 TM103]MCG4454467.1 hypothetical protein [Pseudomonas sp. MMS21 TM103]
MATAKSSFSISRLIELFDKELNRDESKSLDLALKSLAKRLEYCEYHYQLYLENSTPSKLTRERSGIPHNNSIRTQYEANFLAFLNNLHCIVDAAPYALNIIYKQTTGKSIDDKNVGWGDHIKLYSNEKIHAAIDKIINCETFQTIRELSNRSKHKHLIPISNSGESLTIASFSYSIKGAPEIVVPPTNLDEFMRQCHESLIPLVVNLFNEVISIKEKEYVNNNLMPS